MENPSSSFTGLQEVAAWRDQLDREGRRLVFTNGCFDILHAGHVRYLREARALGDALVVGLNSDASVRELKGQGRPVNGEEDRAEVLLGLKPVDHVVLFEERRVDRLIEVIRPHIYAKGGDHRPETLPPEERAALAQAGSEIAILSLVPGRSTSATLAKLAEGDASDGPRRLRLAVLGSGKGSNFRAMLEAVQSGALDAEIVVVISDVPGAGILDLARTAGLPHLVIDPGKRRARLDGAAAKDLVDRIRASRADLVVLAGFMRILEEPVLGAFPERIINLHPSLLPKFPGKDAWIQALEAGEQEAGCTVHLVTAEVDAGPILKQARVPVEPGDTADTLYARIQVAEHRLLPEAVGEYGMKLLQRLQP
jgi:formyltetrahydrofolate-dependent phosphoribosylglycinamide formyltransferase